MSFNDDKFGFIFPTRNGDATGSANERKMLDKLGGSSGLRTEIRNNADGSITTLRTRNGMPDFYTKKAAPPVSTSERWVPPHGIWWSETGDITTQSGAKYQLQGDLPTEGFQRGAGSCWLLNTPEKTARARSLRTPIRKSGAVSNEFVTGASGRFNFTNTGRESWVHVATNGDAWGFYIHHIEASVTTGMLEFDVVKRNLSSAGALESESHVAINMGIDPAFRSYAGYEFERADPALTLVVEDFNGDGSKCLLAICSPKIIRSRERDASGEVAGNLMSRYLWGVLECVVDEGQGTEFSVVRDLNALWPEITSVQDTPTYRVVVWHVNSTSRQGELLYDGDQVPNYYVDPTFMKVVATHYHYEHSATVAIGARYSAEAGAVEIVTLAVDSVATYDCACSFEPAARNMIERSTSTLSGSSTYTIRAGQDVIYAHTDSAQVTGDSYRDLAYRDNSGTWYGGAVIAATYNIAGFQGSLSFSHTVAGDVNSEGWANIGELRMFYADGFFVPPDYSGSFSRGYIFSRAIVGYTPITRLLPANISNLHYYVPIRYSNAVYGLVGGLLHDYEPDNFLVFMPAVGKIGTNTETEVWAHGFKKYYPQHATEHPVTGEVVRRDKPVCWV